MPSREIFENRSRSLFAGGNEEAAASSTHALAHNVTGKHETPEEALESAEGFLKDMRETGTTFNEKQTVFLNEMLEAHTPGSPTYQQRDLIPKRVF